MHAIGSIIAGCEASRKGLSVITRLPKLHRLPPERRTCIIQIKGYTPKVHSCAHIIVQLREYCYMLFRKFQIKYIYGGPFSCNHTKLPVYRTVYLSFSQYPRHSFIDVQFSYFSGMCIFIALIDQTKFPGDYYFDRHFARFYYSRETYVRDRIRQSGGDLWYLPCRHGLYYNR